MTTEGLLSLIFVAVGLAVWELERIRKNLDKIKHMIPHRVVEASQRSAGAKATIRAVRSAQRPRERAGGARPRLQCFVEAGLKPFDSAARRKAIADRGCDLLRTPVYLTRTSEPASDQGSLGRQGQPS
jgi:hypothetical protein